MRLLLTTVTVAAAGWLAVVNDWTDNHRFDRPHSCAAVVIAWTHVIAMSYPSSWQRLPTDLRAEARHVCRPGEESLIRRGMTEAQVAAVAGKPRLPLTGPNCWTYVTRRVCFADGRVALIQRSSHG